MEYKKRDRQPNCDQFLTTIRRRPPAVKPDAGRRHLQKEAEGQILTVSLQTVWSQSVTRSSGGWIWGIRRAEEPIGLRFLL